MRDRETVKPTSLGRQCQGSSIAPLHAALLRAAILHGPDAARAWHEWTTCARVDRLDKASHSLLPLVYANLRGVAQGDLNLDQMKPVYLATWAANQRLFRTVAPLLRTLSERGIDTMLLKGSAVLHLYYLDYGARSMGDVDLLVRRDGAVDAFRALSALGFRPKGRRQELSEIVLDVGHAVSLESCNGQCIDLHWRVLSEPLAVEDSSDVWRRSVPVEVLGVRTLAMGPTDLLLHTILHGTRVGGPSSLRWLADAAKILGADSSHIDWEHLVGSAERDGLALVLCEALGMLGDLLGAAVPRQVMDRLESPRRSRQEYATLRFRSRPLQSIGVPLMLQFRQAQYRHYCTETGKRPCVLGFVRFLRDLWGEPHSTLLPIYGMQKVFRWTFWWLKWTSSKTLKTVGDLLARRVRRRAFRGRTD